MHSPVPTFAQLDRDGALAETLNEADGLTRGGAFRAALAGLGGAVLLGGVGASSAQAATISKKNDIKILQFALVAEHLGSAFYAEAIRKRKLSGETLTYAKTTLRDELNHVKAVSAQIRKLGGTPNPKPDFNFHGATSHPATFRATAAKIEELCVETLNGAGPLVTKSTLMAAGALVSVEARQVTWIRLIINDAKNPVYTAFDKKVTLAQAAAAVKKTHFVQA
jgi:hypothetical protein